MLLILALLPWELANNLQSKQFTKLYTLQTIYKALIQPYFDYCSPLWDTCGKTLQDKLQKFQSSVS